MEERSLGSILLESTSLTEEQLEQVKNSLKRVLDAGKALKEVSLENSDEPYNVFKPYRRKE